MEIKKYWWEEALVEALIADHDNEYGSSSDIILMVAKIIEAEKQNGSTKEK